MADQEWERIMDKIEAGGFGISRLEFRARARRYLDDITPKGYGIGSSDVNHAMFAEAKRCEPVGAEPLPGYSIEEIEKEAMLYLAVHE